MAASSDSPELPDPRIRGRIPTLTEVVDPHGWPPALGDALSGAAGDGVGGAGRGALVDGPPFLDLGEAAPAPLRAASDGLPPLEPVDPVLDWFGHRPAGDGEPVPDDDFHAGDREAADIDAAAALREEAAWTEALLARMTPQIEQIIRDAMRDAQFAALAQVRMALKSQVEAAFRTMPAGEPVGGHGTASSALQQPGRPGAGHPPDPGEHR
jgi:hypothetical protein